MVIPNNATILAIRNRHRQPAPDLQRTAGTDCYVSYFENSTGNQWFFVRPDGAAAATLYGSAVNWQGREVSGDLPADVELDDNERSWLQNTWATSEARRG
jgi:hypothetical protein